MSFCKLNVDCKLITLFPFYFGLFYLYPPHDPNLSQRDAPTGWLFKGGHGDIGTALSGMGPINLGGVRGPKTWIFDVLGPGWPPGTPGRSKPYVLRRSASF